MRSLEHSAANAVQAKLSGKTGIFPLQTLKCLGPTAFRSQEARDVGCLLDVDRNVASWRCRPLAMDDQQDRATPDFEVSYADGRRVFLDAPDRQPSELTFLERLDREHLRLSHSDVYDGFRLVNARDLLRYANWRTSLGDRVRLLAALDENGSLTLAECTGAIQETKPVAGIASLILSGFIEVDLDSAPLGPETTLRRIRP